METSAFSASVSITRPSDTNSYTGGDVIGTTTASGGAVLAFPGVGPSTLKEMLVTTSKLRIDLASIPSGMTSFRLHLYSASPPSAFGDNDVWDLPSGDRSVYLGYVDLGTIVDVGATLFVQSSQINTQFRMPGNAGGNLFGYLVTNGGFTGASGTVHNVAIGTVAL